MFKIIITTAFLGFGALVVKDVLTPVSLGAAGIAFRTAYAPVRETDVLFNIWYPATAGGREITVGGNGVFYGTNAGVNAPRLSGRFPLVLISHGSGGNAGQFGWIASRLAEAGYVVVLPNHPGTTSGNASAEAAVRVWERPADLTAVLDEITQNSDDYPYIDTDRIAALGFSAGGYMAMAVSGARVDPVALQEFCDTTDHGMSDCEFLKRGGVDLHAMDLSPASQDLTDLRIKAAVIIDPGIVETLTDESLAQINIPMLIVNLGAQGDVPIGVDATHAAGLIPNAQFAQVDDAVHFSFLAECKPNGPAILAQEGELDLLCDDAGGRDRAALHRELQGIITAYLNDML